MNNIALALGMAMQSMQLVQQVQQMIAAAVNENRDLSEDELNTLSSLYSATHAAVDTFLAGQKGAQDVTPDGIQGSGK